MFQVLDFFQYLLLMLELWPHFAVCLLVLRKALFTFSCKPSGWHFDIGWQGIWIMGILRKLGEKLIPDLSLGLQRWFAVVFHEQGWSSIWWALPQKFTENSTRVKGAQRSLGRKLSYFKQYKIQCSGEMSLGFLTMNLNGWNKALWEELSFSF